MQDRERELIHDWNEDPIPEGRPPVEFFDETLRDGLQSASVRAPDLEARRAILHFMSDLGIQTANIGFAAASPGVRPR